MGASAMFPLGGNQGTSPVPPANGGMGREREAQFIRRVRELEEEVRVLKADGEKQVRVSCPLLVQSLISL
jgi:hypothetical protein